MACMGKMSNSGDCTASLQTIKTVRVIERKTESEENIFNSWFVYTAAQTKLNTHASISFTIAIRRDHYIQSSSELTYLCSQPFGFRVQKAIAPTIAHEA